METQIAHRSGTRKKGMLQQLEGKMKSYVARKGIPTLGAGLLGRVIIALLMLASAPLSRAQEPSIIPESEQPTTDLVLAIGERFGPIGESLVTDILAGNVRVAAARRVGSNGATMVDPATGKRLLLYNVPNTRAVYPPRIVVRILIHEQAHNDLGHPDPGGMDEQAYACIEIEANCEELCTYQEYADWAAEQTPPAKRLPCSEKAILIQIYRRNYETCHETFWLGCDSSCPCCAYSDDCTEY